jgi:predicted nucleotidyltransferase
MNGLQSTQISSLSEVIEGLKETLTGCLVAVVLFGSRARGDAHEESDWDILVIAHDLPDRPFRRHIFLKAQLPPKCRAAVSLLAKTPEEFEASLPALYLDIALDGIVLYDPHGYMQAKLTRLQTLIRKKGLRREKIEGSFAWQWDKFPGFGWSIEWDAEM